MLRSVLPLYVLFIFKTTKAHSFEIQGEILEDHDLIRAIQLIRGEDYKDSDGKVKTRSEWMAEIAAIRSQAKEDTEHDINTTTERLADASSAMPPDLTMGFKSGYLPQGVTNG
jgi:hypothetical protein